MYVNKFDGINGNSTKDALATIVYTHIAYEALFYDYVRSHILVSISST